MRVNRRKFLAGATAAGVLAGSGLFAPTAQASGAAASFMGGFGFGASMRPLQATFFGQPLPDNTAVMVSDGAQIPDSAAVVAEIVAQSQRGKPNFNVWNWTLEPIIVPWNQPLVPVACSHDTVSGEILHLGIPIPPGTKPTNDLDAAIAIYQPDYVDAIGRQGRYDELQGLRIDPTTGAYSCNYWGRMTGVNTRTQPHYVTWQYSGYDPRGFATDPDSTYEDQNWGVQGSGIPYAPGVLTLADVQRNYVDHALLLEVVDARKGARVWPAVARSDGGLTTSNIIEGMRGRFPAGYTIPSGLHPLCALLVQGVRDRGLVITDRTSNVLCFRAAPSIGAAGYLGSAHDYDVLAGFPWQDLEMLAVGNDTTQTPTA